MLNLTDKYILEKLNPQSKNVFICYGSFSLIAMSKMTNSLRASDRFIQPIFLRIFRRIGTFTRGN